jgi:hypothetical protein
MPLMAAGHLGRAVAPGTSTGALAEHPCAPHDLAPPAWPSRESSAGLGSRPNWPSSG